MSILLHLRMSSFCKPSTMTVAMVGLPILQEIYEPTDQQECINTLLRTKKSKENIIIELCSY